MLGNLGSFVSERVGSLVTKKVGAAVVGGSVAIGAEGPAQGGVIVITVAYIIGQAIVDAAKAWRVSE